MVRVSASGDRDREGRTETQARCHMRSMIPSIMFHLSCGAYAKYRVT